MRRSPAETVLIPGRSPWKRFWLTLGKRPGSPVREVIASGHLILRNQQLALIKSRSLGISVPRRSQAPSERRLLLTNLHADHSGGLTVDGHATASD